MEQKIFTGAVIPPGEIPELLARQMEIKIGQLLSLVRGVYEWRDLPPDKLPDRSLLSALPFEKVLFHGVLNFFPESRIRKEMPGVEKKTFTLAPGFKERVDNIGMHPPVVRWLKTLPDTLSLPAASRTKAMKEEQAFALLLSFYFSGLLVLPPEEDNFPFGRVYVEKEKKPEPKPEPKKEEKVEPKPAAPAAPPPKKEDPKLPIEERLDREMTDEELLQELDDFLAIARDREKNYFDFLGLPETASTPKVKQVYFKFARRFHPDARPDLYQGEVRDRVEDLFTKISEAYNVLGDGESRANYEKSLKSKISKEDMEKATRAIEAEMEFQKAEALMKKSAWKPALELLDRAVSLQPDEPEYKLYQAWANYKIKGPGEAGTARRIIEQIAETRPASADAQFYLGQLARDDGRLSDAEGFFEKAAKLKPHDVEIRRELQLLYRRREKAAEPKKGGFFGKKK